MPNQRDAKPKIISRCKAIYCYTPKLSDELRINPGRSRRTRFHFPEIAIFCKLSFSGNHCLSIQIILSFPVICLKVCHLPQSLLFSSGNCNDTTNILCVLRPYSYFTKTQTQHNNLNLFFFFTGDIIDVHNKQEDGWWIGAIKDRVGIFPATYVEEFV